MMIGLVGKPASGKSSFFKAATMIDVKITGIPFTTIKPNVGIGYLSFDCVDKELAVKCNPKHGLCKNGKRFLPVKLIDVAGLVPGAHQGKGMGNQFLDDLRQASVLIHVVDFSGLTDEEGKPATDHDPSKDIEFLEKEIDLWFSSVVEKAVQKFQSQILKYSKTDLVQVLSEQLSGLQITKQMVVKALEKVSVSNVENFSRELRKLSKPIVIAANKIDLQQSRKNFERLKGEFENITPTSAEAEIALKKAEEKGLIDYLSGNGFELIDSKVDGARKSALELIKNAVIDSFGSTGIQDCLNRAAFELLDYIPVYPVADGKTYSDKDGNVLPDVFLVPRGTALKEFAFMIHTDIGKKFISGLDARTKKKLSADYLLRKFDVVEILHSR